MAAAELLSYSANFSVTPSLTACSQPSPLIFTKTTIPMAISTIKITSRNTANWKQYIWLQHQSTVDLYENLSYFNSHTVIQGTWILFVETSCIYGSCPPTYTVHVLKMIQVSKQVLWSNLPWKNNWYSAGQESCHFYNPNSSVAHSEQHEN